MQANVRLLLSRWGLSGWRVEKIPPGTRRMVAQRFSTRPRYWDIDAAQVGEPRLGALPPFFGGAGMASSLGRPRRAGSLAPDARLLQRSSLHPVSARDDDAQEATSSGSAASSHLRGYND